VVVHSITHGSLKLPASDMAARIAAHDWSRTSLGPPERWPRALRFSLDICLTSTFPTCIYWGPDLVLLYNDAWAPFAAEKHPWALGQAAREIWPDIWDIIGPQLEHVMEHGEGLAFYEQMLPMVRGGKVQETYWNYSLSPLRDEDGRVLGVFSQAHEITKEVLAQKERENEIAWLRALFDQAPGIAALLEGPQHVYVLANKAYLRLVGREDKDVLGKPVAEVLPEVVAQGFIDLFDRVYRTGEPFVGTGASVRLVREPGMEPEERIVDFVIQPVKYSKRTTRLFVQATDVTERARAEAALRASEENLRRLNERLELRVAERTAELREAVGALQELVNRMRTAFQTSFIYQGYLRPDGTLLEINAQSLEGIDGRSEDAIGRPFWETPWFSATPGAPELVKDAVQRVARGEHFRCTTELNLPIGRRTFDFSIRPVKNEQGEVIGIFPEAVDLTPLLQAEERLRQSQKMEAIGQLTGGIAHDFNNLLTGIIGALDMMQRRLAQGRYDKVDDYAKAALASANRAAALTHRLLAFARRQPLGPKPVVANMLIAEMEDMLRRTLGEKNELQVIPGSRLWLTRCDPNQLESAILNLAINARDAMPDGGRITIETSNVTLTGSEGIAVDPGEYICIRVTDTGIGMEPAVIAKAFDPFFTTKPLGQGTGLGLSMTYGFVRQSGGDITIKSIPGEGTTICLCLPRYLGEVEEATTSMAGAHALSALEERTVLVVEDDEVVRRLILDVLAELRVRVLEARTGAAGLAILMSNQRIDLLISDVGLPELDGRQMVERARPHRPDLRTLFITGYADADPAIKDLGPRTQLMVKPFPMEVLVHRIGEMLAN